MYDENIISAKTLVSDSAGRNGRIRCHYWEDLKCTISHAGCAARTLTLASAATVQKKKPPKVLAHPKRLITRAEAPYSVVIVPHRPGSCNNQEVQNE